MVIYGVIYTVLANPSDLAIRRIYTVLANPIDLAIAGQGAPGMDKLLGWPESYIHGLHTYGASGREITKNIHSCMVHIRFWTALKNKQR